MKKITSSIKVFIAFFLITLTSNAQVFTLNGGYQTFTAQEAGTPGFPNGNVLVRKAPPATGNINRLRQTLNQATIPDAVIQSRLTEGPLAGYIAQMPAVISTANQLNSRPESISVNGAIIINSTASLNSNRSRIRNNNTETYIFRGNVNSNEPIVIGSNKTFWIDGKLTYSGPDRPLANTDALSPIPIIRDGLFRIRNKRNVTINGTKRGLVDCRGRIPFAYALDSNTIKVVGNEVINSFNTVFMHQTRMVTIEDNFFYNNVRRAMHIIAVNTASIKNNLCYGNHLDGIDIDAFSQNCRVDSNVVLGVTFRFMVWTEIDAHDNIMNNNVAIHLPGRKARRTGGMQENGTENSRRGVGNFRGSRNNDWTNNNVFYPETLRDGIVMRRDRFIQHNTINFRNNYVWSVEGNGKRHNPKPQNNITNDVRFLTTVNPAAGTRPAPSNPITSNVTQSPPNLTTAQTRVTPGLFGGNTPPNPPTPPTPPNNQQLIANGTYFINSSVSQNKLVDTNAGFNNRNVKSENNNNNRGRWIFNHIGDNVYTIRNVGTNRFLEVPFAECENGSNVATWQSAGSSHQRWKIVRNNGSFSLLPNHCTERALDRSGGRLNTNAQIWIFKNTNRNQRWNIQRVNGSKNTLNNSLSDNITVSPNPINNNEVLNISLPDSNNKVTVNLSDLSGKRVFAKTINNRNTTTINMSNLNITSGYTY